MHDHHHDHDHQNHGASPWPALLQSLLIGGIGGMLLVKVFSGALPLYIHVRYTPLILGTGVALLLLALLHGWFTLRGQSDAQGHADADGPASWRSAATLALLLPILLGLLVPSRALGSAAIDSRGFGTSATGMRSVQSIGKDEGSLGLPDPTTWTLLDWVNAVVYQPDNPRVQGQPIEVTGFVWRRPEMADDQFIVSRFVVSCCTADSLAIGLPVIWPGGSEFQTDSWVRVRGTMALAEIDGRQEAVIQAEEVIPIEQPAEPYIYP